MSVFEYTEAVRRPDLGWWLVHHNGRVCGRCGEQMRPFRSKGGHVFWRCGGGEHVVRARRDEVEFVEATREMLREFWGKGDAE